MREPTERELGALVQREVLCCMSALVSGLAELQGQCERPSTGAEIAEQAAELCYPVPDYEEAATDAGWEQFQDEYGANCYRDTNDDQTWTCDGWAELCAEFDIEPFDRDVFEHWAVTPWLGRKLVELGEKVDDDFAGLTIWARTTTGQAISMDYVIRQVWEDIQRPFSERLAGLEPATIA